MKPVDKGDSKPPVPPTLEEIAGEILAAIEEEDDEGATVGELADVWGVDESTVRRRLKKLKKQGRLIEGRKTFKDVLGRTQRVRVVRVGERNAGGTTKGT